MILGKEDPAASPWNTGFWAVLTLQPYQKARSSIGEGPVDIQDAREIAWSGEGMLVMHNILDNGETVQFSMAGYDRHMEGSGEWRRTVTAEELKKIFVGKGWLPHMEKSVVEVRLKDQEIMQIRY
jgi:salicylate hydroxylase